MWTVNTTPYPATSPALCTVLVDESINLIENSNFRSRTVTGAAIFLKSLGHLIISKSKLYKEYGKVMFCSMSQSILIAAILSVLAVNSVESSNATISRSRLVKRSGVRNMAVPLETLQVSHLAVCALMCMRRHGCVCCNLGSINNVTKNRACELMSGENISLAAGGSAVDWTSLVLVGKLTYCTVPSLYACNAFVSV